MLGQIGLFYLATLTLVSANPFQESNVFQESHTDEDTMPAYDLPPQIAQNIGVYSARYTVSRWGRYSHIPSAVPEGCEVVQANILHRHGARYPTSDSHEEIIAAIQKVSEAVARNPDLVQRTPLRFMTHYDYSAGDNSLVDFGRKQIFVSGKQAAKRYAKLAPKGLFVRTTSKDRVFESSGWFRHGFTGGSYPVPIGSLPVPDLSLPTSSDFNSTLSGDRCQGPEAPPETPDPSRFWLETYAPHVASRINGYLPGLALDSDDIYALMSNCGLETAMNAPSTSPWCRVFQTSEWTAHEYKVDLEKYWTFGYGSPTGRARGSGWVNELISRLTGTPVLISGSINATLDTNHATFPIPPDSPAVFADFSSDNNISNMIAALGIIRDASPLPLTGPPPPGRLFVASKMVPFAAELIVEKLACSGLESGQATGHMDLMAAATNLSQDYVRVILNGGVVPLVFEECGASELGTSLGLCALDGFVRAQSFSQGGGNWDAVCTVPA